MVPKLLAEVLTHVPKVVFEPAQVAHLNAVPPRGGDLPITSYFYFEVAYTRKCQGYQKGKGFKRKAKQPKFAHVPTACTVCCLPTKSSVDLLLIRGDERTRLDHPWFSREVAVIDPVASLVHGQDHRLALSTL
eukprot:548703-Prorocentrum_minimum.AAC.1